MIRKIILAPDKTLKNKSLEITDEDVYTTIIQDLLDTLRATNGGVGIAAPQIGINKKVCIVGNRIPLILVNPVITWHSKETKTEEEGCLSLPGKIVAVTRPIDVELIYMNEFFWNIKIMLYGPMARIAQHEIDHLSGTLITDYEGK